MPWIEAERLRLADFLDTLGDDDWSVQSLCGSWTVHDVAAHLTMVTRIEIPSLIVGAIKSRFNFNRMVDAGARDLARKYTPAELIARFRETAASPKRAPGSSPLDPLVDVLVHGQDIAVPLGRPLPMPTEQALAALGHASTAKFYGAQKRFAGLRLVASDADWTLGDGDEVRGPVSSLLLLSTGRPVGLENVDGPGVPTLTARVTRS
ncbi:hypothetical protein GCM10007304_10590 [Rhodococcoides trifolii]|uniref:Mycothiol-dependent maleylpyruvate isomerase metal-binding domain-containing protein n=2 Tax=Rhodococcoides trifolii TaxID=908250 RepID=A0A917CVP8_9NOCA|nr:hypothetical protein GCM10007304_10590 [Rhodococcus trifolii]